MEGDEGPAASHQEVLDAVEKRSTQMQNFVKEIIHVVDDEGFLKTIPDLSIIALDKVQSQYKKRKIMSMIYGDSSLSLGVLGFLTGTILTWSFMSSRRK